MTVGIFGGPILWKYGVPQKSESDQKIPKQESASTTEKNTEKKSTTEKESTNFSEIRVLISNNRLGSYSHNKIKITSAKPYYMKTGKKSVQKKAGEITILDFKRDKQGQTVTFSGAGKLQLLSVKRSYGNPSYRGTLEVRYGKSSMTVINQLLLEEYLYAVIPSEMPVSYGLEALKVQAVCARSFAIRQIQGNKFASYHANVDDSVASQVYNNTKETNESIQAALDTAGEVICYKDQVISAYFFSTSWGHTADSHDVWLQKGDSPLYLTGKLQNGSNEKLDLSTDEKVKKFLNQNIETYDSSFPWYRWSVTLPISKLAKSSIGSIRNVAVNKRGNSGVAKSLRITGSGGVKVVQGEYNIRQYLSPKGYKIKRKDGSTASADILPSGCFYLEQKGNNLKIYGGGYGHGVGMSQNGVKRQIELGKNYQQIIKYYYTGTKIEQISMSVNP